MEVRLGDLDMASLGSCCAMHVCVCVCVCVCLLAAGMLVFAKWRELQRLSKHTSVCQLGAYCCLCAGSLGGGPLNGASCAEREESWPLRLEDDNS